MLELKKLVVDTKSAWVDFQGLKGFSVKVATLSRQEMGKLRKACVTSSVDRRTQIPIETLDEEKFIRLFAEKIIKDWKGLTLEYLESLILIDIGEADLQEELKFTLENAEVLINSSKEFDDWLNEVVFNLDNFRSPTEE